MVSGSERLGPLCDCQGPDFDDVKICKKCSIK
jgi:hypothetical protein